MKSNEQIALRMYVRAREDFQAMRIRMNNRLGRKANNDPQKIQDARIFSVEDFQNMQAIADEARRQEAQIAKYMLKLLKKFPVYNEWLKNVKGVGEISAAWLLAEFDIEEATTVSKMWQYAGLNPGMVRGKKRVSKSAFKPGMGTIVDETPNIKTGERDYLIVTNEMVRGDRPTPGFVLPYNGNLKTQLLGVMGSGFVMQKSVYATEFYYPYKARLEQEKNAIQNNGTARKDDGKAWSEVSKGHRDRAAIRYMVKMFLADFYAAWREIEGLPVREPYAAEYLGKVHA